MKINKLNVSGLAATIALASVMVACGGKDEKAGSSTTKTVDSTVVAGEKIVYVNSDSLLSKYEYFKAIKSKIETETKAAESDYSARLQAFQRDAQQYQSQANTMPADQRAATEQRLQRKQQELQAYQQNAGAALQNKSAKENEALYNKVADYLKGYAKTKGYKMVLGYSKSNPTILFADESLDVTSEVIKGLNDQYAKEKK